MISKEDKNEKALGRTHELVTCNATYSRKSILSCANFCHNILPEKFKVLSIDFTYTHSSMLNS